MEDIVSKEEAMTFASARDNIFEIPSNKSAYDFKVQSIREENERGN